MNKTLVASSKNRNVASSFTVFLSTDGWASKSKSSKRHGDGQRGEALQAGPPTDLGGTHLDREQAFQEGGVAQLVRLGVVELTGQRLGGGGQTQVGEMRPHLLIDRVLAHAVTSTSAA